MPAVGRPGGVFIPAGRRELPDPAPRNVDEKKLGAAGDLTMEYDAGPVGRPLRSVGTARRAEIERREQLLIGSVGGHDVDLGRSRPRGNERDAAAIWRKRWR